MNVLLLISQLPYPPDTGAKIRTFNLIKRLSVNNNLTLLAFGDTIEEKTKIEALKCYCREIRLFKRNAMPKYLSLFLNLFSRFPYNIKKYYSKKMEECIVKFIKDSGFDLIHCDSLQMSLNMISVNGLPKILTEHNIESEILRRYMLNETSFLKKVYIFLQWKKLAQYEFSSCKMLGNCIVVSENDALFLKKKTEFKNIFIVPNGVDCDFFKPGNIPVKPFSMVFTGSLDWLPNEDALVYFFSEIYPLIKQRNAQVNISIVGRNPSRKIIRFAENDKTITVTGRVEDVRPFVAEAKVFVVPLRIGGGTRLKILESMAMAKPVISTSIGAEGIEVTHGKNIILADNPQEFTEQVIGLLNNNLLAIEFGEAGRRLVEEKYSWHIISRLLENAWLETTNAALINER